ncbi:MULTISPECIES: hypothetical protein [unclassified Arenibacter]|jgi:hypothetical protein|uniref:hypothetical protein n=1 Tax=unclassified Arenibacter TaxID=2615047 RepID=UPI000E344E88|nr:MULTISPECIES: hypothetical protein [unclassified Arenibacter]MCM4165644.1 hypothetical protein [Arenibacter sp. A80]RFT54790.1 hypothetical protein D0S24_18740 [Arenibacter sp. P308M17]
MKTLLTLIFVLFIGMAAQANNVGQETKVETVTMGIVTVLNNKVSVKTENKVARLYMFKNSRIKKELSFTTKMNKAKLA